MKKRALLCLLVFTMVLTFVPGSVQAAGQDISDRVSLEQFHYPYTGGPVELKLWWDWLEDMVEGTDFILRYREQGSDEFLDSAPTDLGEYEVSIEGINDYEGTQLEWFVIVGENDLIFAEAEGEYLHIYSGQPVVTILAVRLGDKLLVEGQDYDLSYDKYVGDTLQPLESAPSEIGEYIVWIEGKNDYTGGYGLGFSIVAQNDIRLAVHDLHDLYPYTGKALVLDFYVRWEGRLLEEGRDYRLSYKDASTDQTLKTPPSAVGSYWLMVEGIGQYVGIEEWWIEITDDFPDDDIFGGKLTIDQDYFVYDGREVKPAPTLERDGKILRNEVDYWIFYQDLESGDVVDTAPRDKGRYALWLQGENEYWGFIRAPFTIGTFEDITPKHWAYSHAEVLYEKEIISGYRGTRNFAPDQPILRKEVAKMVALGAGLKASPGFHSTFTDVKAAGWEYEFVAALEEADVVTGFKGTKEFRPNQPIKRNHVAKMVVKAFNLKMGDVAYDLTDIKGVDCEDEIRILASNGIVSGYKGTSNFLPNREISRAEFAKVIELAMQVAESGK